MDAGGRQETPGSETRAVITHGAASSITVRSVLAPFAPEATGARQMAQADACTCAGLQYRTGTLSLENPPLCIQHEASHFFAPEGDFPSCFMIVYGKHNPEN